MKAPNLYAPDERVVGDRITLKNGSSWTIAEVLNDKYAGPYYRVSDDARERFTYEDEIASAPPTYLERKVDFETRSGVPLKGCVTGRVSGR